MLSDADHMAQALWLARRRLGDAWPNPSVGCVVVAAHGEVAGRACTGRGGRPHAETLALAKAGKCARGSTVYVSLEPCAHHSKTPPCAEALIAAKPARVVIGLRDPDPRVSGQGIAKLTAAGIEVTQGVLEAEARDVALGHCLRVTERRPAVLLKLAVGSDSLIPRGDGRPNWITGEMARAHGHLLRARSDAILTGRGTILADDPLLTCRLPGLENRSPLRVILDSLLRTPLHARLFSSTESPIWILCTEDAPKERAAALADCGAEIVRVAIDATGRISTRAALEALAERGITRVLVEGGPTVAHALLEEDLVDMVGLYQANRPTGETGLLAFASEGLDRLVGSGHFTASGSRALGPDRLTWWRRERTCSQD
jgi:diaminohydroxyphosphoribosylaminopyrimidine deaminase / 5-amino-6-(5-phosphoribosylamino)uracil reductase